VIGIDSPEADGRCLKPKLVDQFTIGPSRTKQ
jgi:hypothetical protein